MALVAMSAYAYGLLSRPRVWPVGSVPVAFWAWRWRTPSAAEIQRAKDVAGANLIFVRAGQLDYSANGLELIRRVQGRIPDGLPIDLVYNATPSFLARFGSLDAAQVASFVGDQFSRQSTSALAGGSVVDGLQLDLDIPTRLLSGYAKLLRVLRTRLPGATRLSITGLPTWIESSELRQVLKYVDFWVPQAYGAKIAENTEEFAAIATPREVASTVDGARMLGYPFYVGLPAYSYTSLYSVSGHLIGLRGDVSPRDLLTNRELELIRSSGAQPSGPEARGIAENVAVGCRYDFRARADTGIGGFTVRQGETLAFSSMTASVLRACSRVVRERAGGLLLGICVFRLPGDDDKANLVIEQVAAALEDKDSGPLGFDVEAGKGPDPAQLSLAVLNTSNVASIIGTDAVQLELEVPSGSLREITGLDGFRSGDGLYSPNDTGDAGTITPCTIRRANLVRLGAPCWVPGSRLRAMLQFRSPPKQDLRATMRVRTDDGRVLVGQRVIELRRQ
jgi:hypothetical protein